MTYHFDGQIAKEYGVDAAVFIAMLQFWIAKNEANDRHFHDGRYWTYNSIRAMERISSESVKIPMIWREQTKKRRLKQMLQEST